MDNRIKYYIDPKTWLIRTAVYLMASSIVLRFVGTWGLWNDRLFAITQIVLPTLACVLFIVSLQLFGKKLFWLTTIPIMLGLSFFIIQLLNSVSILNTIVCTALCCIVAVVYIGTVFGFIRTKWLLVIIFAATFLYKVGVRDVAAMRTGNVSFADGVQEMSTLCILLSLFFTSAAMKKVKPEEKTEPAAAETKESQQPAAEEMAEPEISEENPIIGEIDNEI